jgi:outer membrane lipoprotein-sorting protein
MQRIPIAVLALLLTALAAAQETPPAVWSIEQLMQLRAQVKSGRAGFVEIRKMPSVETTATSNGVLIYEAPDRIERQTLKPLVERSVVQGDRLTLEIETAPGQHTRREFALADIPGLRPFFAALRATLAGDLAALRQNFEISFSGDENDWRLKLVPRERSDLHVREILISGRAAEILAIEVDERNGGSSRTLLNPEPTKPPAPASDAPAPSAGS